MSKSKTPAAKQAAPAAKEEVKRDQFGSRVTSQAATINAAMTAKPQTVAEVATATELDPARVRSHLAYLVGKGFIVSGDSGYSLPTKKPAKAKPAKAKAAK
jgi:predicted ArsR family transcriptional regulator